MSPTDVRVGTVLPGLSSATGGGVLAHGELPRVLSTGEADELHRNSLDPSPADLRPRARLGRDEAATLGARLLPGLHRAQRPTGSNVLSSAGPDSAGDLAEEVRLVLRDLEPPNLECLEADRPGAEHPAP